MPKPAFIICSQGSVEDKDTGLLTLFNITEKIQVTPVPIPQGGQPTALVVEVQPLVVNACWMKEEQDPQGQEYESEIMIYSEPDRQMFGVGKATFKFAANRPLHRGVLRINYPLPIRTSGLVIIEARIRKAGQSDDPWIDQKYQIITEVMEPVNLQGAQPSPSQPTDSPSQSPPSE